MKCKSQTAVGRLKLITEKYTRAKVVPSSSHVTQESCLAETSAEARPGKAFLYVLLPFKTMSLGLVVFALFHYLAVQPLGLMAGIALMVLIPLPLAAWVAMRQQSRAKESDKE